MTDGEFRAMPTGLKRKLDYSDYAAIPPDGKRCEILDGAALVTPAPSPLHQRVSKRLQRQLEAYFETGSRAEVFNATRRSASPTTGSWTPRSDAWSAFDSGTTPTSWRPGVRPTDPLRARIGPA
jgi:hypothetical protein